MTQLRLTLEMLTDDDDVYDKRGVLIPDVQEVWLPVQIEEVSLAVSQATYAALLDMLRADRQ